MSAELRKWATQLLALYDWRPELAKAEADPHTDPKWLKKELRQYGERKKAGWAGLRAALAGGDCVVECAHEWLDRNPVDFMCVKCGALKLKETPSGVQHQPQIKWREWAVILESLLRATRTYVADVPTNGATTLLGNIDNALAVLKEDLDAAPESVSMVERAPTLAEQDAKTFKTCWDAACNDLAERDDLIRRLVTGTLSETEAALTEAKALVARTPFAERNHD